MRNPTSRVTDGTPPYIEVASAPSEIVIATPEGIFALYGD